MGHFKSSRGLCQGDPISPFLFILVTDVLSWLLLQKEHVGLLHRAKIARNCPPVSHLMFANDLIVFSHATMEGLEAIKSCLSQFQSWSGLAINPRKSTISFSKNTSHATKTQLCTHMGLRISDTKALYLGLPLSIKRGQDSPFLAIVEKNSQCVSRWKAKVLSQTARATLIKLVLSALLSYWMSSFQIPKNIYEKIDSKFRDFFWGFMDTKKHLYPKALDLSLQTKIIRWPWLQKIP